MRYPVAINQSLSCREVYFVQNVSLFAALITGAAFSLGFLLGYDQAIETSIRLDTETENAETQNDFFLQRTLPSSTLELLGELSKQRKSVEAKLVRDYGGWSGVVFDKMKLRKIFVLSDEARERMQRRMMMKILAAQMEPTAPVTFTWATAGDSSAAGHGNLYNESYTSLIDDTVNDVFASVGVDFVAKNYAMEGYGSGPELAMCMESVYGSDLDIISWDFGMTDGDLHHRAALWGNRAAVHPTKPVLFMMDSSASGRFEQFSRLEGKGMGAVLMDFLSVDSMKRLLPDTNNPGLSQDNLPPALHYFLCNGATEGSAPCSDQTHNYRCDTEDGAPCRHYKYKFKTSEKCGGRFRTSWHPGWKEHMLRGRLIGFFLLQVLQDALLELDLLINSESKSKSACADWKCALVALQKKDDLDKFLFQSSPPSFEVWDNHLELLEGIDPNHLYQSNSVCRSSLFPSQSRYYGALGDAETKATSIHSESIIDISQSSNGTLPLVLAASRELQCTAGGVDHRDFFQVREGDGWLSTMFPSPREMDYYGKDEHNVGMLMVCFRTCTEAECLKPLYGLDGIKLAHGNIAIEVDGEPVVGTREIEGCHFLESNHGLMWGISGKHELKFLVHEPEISLQITSIVSLQPSAF